MLSVRCHKGCDQGVARQMHAQDRTSLSIQSVEISQYQRPPSPFSQSSRLREGCEAPATSVAAPPAPIARDTPYTCSRMDISHIRISIYTRRSVSSTQFLKID